MATSRQRVRIIGLPGALRAMRRWLTASPRTQLSFQAVSRPRHTVTIRLEPAAAGLRARRPAS